LAKYVGVNGKTHQVVAEYVGVNGKTHQVVAEYVGVNGVTKEIFSNNRTYYGKWTVNSANNVGGMVADDNQPLSSYTEGTIKSTRDISASFKVTSVEFTLQTNDTLKINLASSFNSSFSNSDDVCRVSVTVCDENSNTILSISNEYIKKTITDFTSSTTISSAYNGKKVIIIFGLENCGNTGSEVYINDISVLVNNRYIFEYSGNDED
jgi:hypothetical protein